ncbi:hypothetical protein [Legionella massiliensis]|uniref:hypothetical protein n=1 Tax=Legionella massiliensis TaxID=1034943 RepID=UPI00114681A1|nr:hypothetical protein [Legionella massiliensis]
MERFDELSLDIEETDLTAENVTKLAKAFQIYKSANKLNKDNFFDILDNFKNNRKQFDAFVNLYSNEKQANLFKKVDPESLLNMDENQLLFLNAVLAKTNPKHVNQELIDFALAFSKKPGVKPEHAQQLSDCLNAIYGAEVPITQAWSSKNRLQNFLKQVDSKNIKDVSTVLNSLKESEALNKDSFDNVMNNAPFLSRSNDIEKIFEDMREVGLPVKDYQQRIIQLAVDDDFEPLAATHDRRDPSFKLPGLKDVLHGLSSVELPKKEGAKEAPKLGLKPKLLDTLLANVDKLDGKAASLKECFQALVNNGIPHNVDGKSNRLEALIKLDDFTKDKNCTKIKAVASILTSLDGSTPPPPKKPSFLDGSKLDDILAQAALPNSKLVANAPQICKAFDAVREAGISLKGLRGPIMSMENSKDLENLATILGELKADPNKPDQIKEKLDTTAVKVLIANTPKMDKENAQALGKAIRQLQNHGIALTDTTTAIAQAVGTNKIGQDNNLNKLLTLNTAQLNAVSTILSKLPKNINNESTLRHILDKGTLTKLTALFHPMTVQRDGKDVKFTSFADIYADAFENINKAGVDLKGHRADILKMSPTEAFALSNIMHGLKKSSIPLNTTEFETLKTSMTGLVNNIVGQIKFDPTKSRDLQIYDAINAHTKQLGEVIGLIRGNGHSLTGFTAALGQLIGDKKLSKDSHLARLLEMNTAEVTAVNKVLSSLKGETIDENILKHVMAKAKDLSTDTYTVGEGEHKETFTRAELAANIFNLMDKPLKITQKGHRADIVNMKADELHAFHSILEKLGPKITKPLDATDFGILRASIPALLDNLIGDDRDPSKNTPAIQKVITEHTTSLGNVINIIQANHHSLTGIGAYVGQKLGIDSLKKDSHLGRLLEMDTDQLKSVETVLGSLKTETVNESILKKILAAENLQEILEVDEQELTRADLLSDIFKKMDGTETSIGITQKGHRTALLEMPIEDLYALKTALDKIQKPKPPAQPLDATDFTALRESIPVIKEKFFKELVEPEIKKLDSLKEELKALEAELLSAKDEVIELTDIAQGNVDEEDDDAFFDRLDSILPDDDEDLGGDFDNDLEDAPPSLSERIAQLKYDIRSQEKQIEEKKAEALTKAYAHAGKLGEAVNMIKQQGVALTGASAVVGQALGSSALSQDNLITSLAKLGPKQLESVTNILNVLGKDPKPGSTEFNSKIVNFLIENSDELAEVANKKGKPPTPITNAEGKELTRGEIIVNVLTEMNNAGIPFKDRRELMKKDAEELNNLASVLGEVNKKLTELNGGVSKPLPYSTFEMIRDNIGAFKGQDAEKSKALASCIASLTNSGINLKNPLFGNKVEELMNKSAKELTEVAKVLNVLAGKANLDPKTYKNLMERSSNLVTDTIERTLKDGTTVTQTRADLLVEVYGKMRKVEGYRQPLMDLDCKQLEKMSNKLDELKANGKYSTSTDIKGIIEDIKEDPNYGEPLIRMDRAL